jgi:peptide/nickel transport system permease protein
VYKLANYLVRRLIRTVFVLLFITLIVFVLLHLSGDPIALLLGQEATPDEVNRVRHELGLDQPMWVQFGRFLSNLARGDFGESLVYGSPAINLLADRLPNTVQLTTVAITLAVLLSIPLGVLSAVKQGSIIDSIILGTTLLGQAIPGFWLGIMLILLMAVQLQLLPTSGKDSLKSIILPAVTLAAHFLARFTLLLRTSMIEALLEDYIRTARSKGLPERVVIYTHALRNAIIPLVTMIGMSFGQLLGGAVITETVFAWPGVGYLAVQAVYARDYAIVQASVFVIVLGIVICNWLVDLLYPLIDPRITVT